MLDHHTDQFPQKPNIRSRGAGVAAFAAALAVLLVVAWSAYRPGLTGTFLLDDFSNLPALGATGVVDNWDALLRYVTSGGADPTGRPLSLLSFLLDAQNWPAPAQPFKYTNILLHLLNGALLCWAMLALAHRRGIPESRASIAALIGAGIWLLHPLLVSTTLYVIQREAMLPATFTFVGIVCWCSGRNAFDSGKVIRAIIWMTAGAWLCTLLATLSKANGILLPLLLVMAEATVLRTSRAGQGERIRRAVRFVLLGLPILLLLAYLAYSAPSAIRIAESDRSWTVGQRLLTEPRILTEYLRLLWIPQATSFGVFNDQIQASRSLFQPWTTAPCVALILALIGAGWLLRRRHPIVAFAILFFFAGHLLESSFLPLELAFEHRNYLPAAFMFWPIGVWVSSPKSRSLIGYTVAIAALCLLAFMTWTRAGVWGNVQLQARLWGHINPDSPQAQSFSASVEAASGDLPDAIAKLRAAAIRMPDQPQVGLTLVSMECQSGAISPQSWDRTLYALHHTKTQWNNIANWLVTSIPDATNSRCTGLTTSKLKQAVAAVKSNAKFARWHPYDRAFERAEAAILLAEGQPSQAESAFDSLLASNPDPGDAVEQAKALDAFGYPKLALHHLEHFSELPSHSKPGMGMPRLHAWILNKQEWWPRQISNLKKSIEEAAATKGKPAGKSTSI